MNQRYLKALLILVCMGVFAALLTPSPAFSQASIGTILGVVKDTTGGTVGGAAVTVTNSDTGLTRTATTGDDGAYRFPALPVGNYQIQVMKDGFQTAQRKGIVLEVTQEASIDFALQVGATGQTVTVTEEAPLVQTTSSSVGGLVSEQQVADLPLNGRNLVDLTLMQAGITQTTVVPTTTMGNGMQNGVTFSSNGAPIHSNAYLLDGANMTSTMGLNNVSVIGTTLGVDGVKEYKVVTNLPTAEYGLSMGSSTVIVSKGGTNQFHGDAFDYLRNGSLDARNFFDALDKLNFNGDGTNKSFDFPGKRIPPFHRNNFGGSIGGPIKKDKLFFYAVYEGLRQTWGQTIATNTLPGSCFDQTPGSPTFHQITASSLLTGPTAANLQQGCAGLPAGTAVNPAVLYVLTTPNIIPGQVGLFPYPDVNVDANGNKLPGATSNYSFAFIQPSEEDYGQARVDYNLSAADSLFLRYTQDDARQIANRSYAFQRDVLFGGEQFLTLSETHIFSPTVLNTFRASASRNLGYANSTTTSPITDPRVILQPGQNYGGFTPASTVTGIGSLVDGLYINNTYSFSDDVYWTKGKHALKIGELFNIYRVPEDGHFNNRGSVTFTTLANMVNGVYGSILALGGTISPSQNRYFEYKTQGAYIQDDLRATARLTLNLGFRYEFTSIPTELNGRNWVIPNIATANGLSPTQGAVPGAFWSNNPSYHAFSPRIGFAFDPFGNGKTAIRGGGGIYYDLGNYGALLFQEACCQPPLDFFNTINNSFSSVSAMTAAGLPTFQIPLPIAYGSAPVTASNPNGVISNLIGTAAPRSWSPNQNQPAMYQWNLTIDRQLPGNEDLTVGYVGTRGTHLVQIAEGNPTTILGYLPSGLPYYCHPADNPTGPPSSADPCPATAVFPVKSNPTYGPVNQDSDGSDSWYHGLQVGWTQRTKHGVQAQIAYTWSKLLDTGQGQQGLEAGVGEATYYPQVRQLDKGVAGFNAAGNLRGNVIYHAPDFKSDKFYAKPLMGWWFSSIASLQSGYPFDPLIGDRSLSNNPTSANASSDRPSLDPSFNLASIYTHDPANWFNESMYDLPLAGTLGNAPRYGLRGPDLINLDFSVNKDTKARFLGEQGDIVFKAEFFNIANRPNFSNPSANILSLSSPAQIQCGPQFATVMNHSTVQQSPTCQFQPAGTLITSGPDLGKANPLAAASTAGQITTTVNRSRQIQLSLKVIF